MSNLKNVMLLISLIGYHFIYSQETDLKISDDHFLLGTLEDYSGRNKSSGFEDLVDHYYKYEDPLMDYLRKTYIKQYPDFSVDTIKRKIFCKDLAKKMNAFYDYDFNGKYTLTDDFQRKDSVFNGTLKPNLFQNDLEKISFIVGIYARYGEYNNSKYCIRLYNSKSKAKECSEILKQLGCDNIELKIENKIPLNQIISFSPKTNLNKYLEHYMFLRKEIVNEHPKF